MLYFAYGSNLNHHQMKKDRCVGSQFLQSFTLKDYKLVFSHSNKLNKFGYANVIKKKGSKVLGAIWKITKKHDLTKPQGVRGRNSDNSLFNTLLEWEPTVSLSDGLETTYFWIENQMKNNPAYT